MSDRNKNKKSQPNDFLSYQRGEMTGAERNSFERELQKDPFAEEAAEGFSEISAENTENDLSNLHKRLNKKTIRKSRFAFYRIAAAVAVLLVVSTIYILTQRKSEVIALSENLSMEKMSPVDIPVPEAIIGPPFRLADNTPTTPTQSPIQPKTEEKLSDNLVAETEVSEPAQIINQDSISTKSDLSVSTGGGVAVTAYGVEKKMARAARATASAKSSESELVRDYIPPQPVIGKDSFDIYLKDNTRNPKRGTSGTVVISFKVQPDSTISGIKIISSPGREWSIEAIRLIKEGPKWKPALQNGNSKSDEVKVSINFK
jgi:outer membrane biosynthesis protein TonB